MKACLTPSCLRPPPLLTSCCLASLYHAFMCVLALLVGLLGGLARRTTDVFGCTFGEPDPNEHDAAGGNGTFYAVIIPYVIFEVSSAFGLLHCTICDLLYREPPSHGT
eukprot:2125776-Pyramimonas_sp.AAC.2